MGTDKALVPFRGRSLLDAVIARASPQVGHLAINIPRDTETAYRARYGEAVLPDLFTQTHGPLCGIVTGLAWLGADWLATFPCDTPFLPGDLVVQLAKPRTSKPVFAFHGGRMHGVCALWPKSSLARLKEGVESGALRSMRQAFEAFDAAACEIAAGDHAFFNVNTLKDLEEAERLGAREGEASDSR